MRLHAWVLVLVLTWGAAAAAETRALLIGVSDYPEETGFQDLKGPANDVQLMRDVLAGRGATDITLLADQVAGAAVPTRAAILAAFADLAARVQPGDFVYVHFSGHGSRQRDENGDEGDGYDEVFLPGDTGRAEPGAGVFPNALTDDEIGAAVQALQAVGADVWVVMDSCHAGSGLRSGSAEVALRYVPPPDGAAAAVQPEAAVLEPLDEDLPGGVLAFYAAWASEPAREVNMGDGWYGLFTAKLAARLESGAAMTFRQLFQAVLSDMNSGLIPGAARMQTPIWEGGLIDAAVFGGAETVGQRRFALRGPEIAAGRLHGLQQGTVLRLFADVADPSEAALGTAQMELVGARNAFLRPVAATCRPEPGVACPTSGALPRDARFAEVAYRPVSLTVGVAPPRDLASGAVLPEDSAPYQALAAAIGALNAGGAEQMALTARAYEVETVWDGAALWFGPRAVVEGAPVGLAVDPTDDLVPILRRIARAEEYVKLLAAVAETAPFQTEVEVTPLAYAGPVSRLQPVGAGATFDTECQHSSSLPLSLPGAPLAPGQAVKQCDLLAVSGSTAGARAFDVNRVFIDESYCAYGHYARIDGPARGQRLGPNLRFCSDCGHDAAGEVVSSAGLHRMFVVISAALPNQEAFRISEAIGTCGGDAGLRSPSAIAAQGLMARLAAVPGLRGAREDHGIADIWVERFDWQLLSRAAAFARAGQ